MRRSPSPSALEPLRPFGVTSWSDVLIEINYDEHACGILAIS
jgi:hypothetical protein